tara:strand:- start:2212 stop:3162 length:951 start_codon:yes stop_codon:yes gene_type:complete
MKNYILINGLIRNEEIFYKQFEIYKKLINENIINEIVLCIDKEILKDGNNIPLGNKLENKIRFFLETNNVKIIEINNLSIDEIKKIDPIIEKRPRNKLRKNTLSGLSLWRPMYSLKKGLELLDKDSFVLKTRPDMLISYNLIKKIFIDYKVKLEKNDFLEYKIWSSGFNQKELFYIMDFTFAGKREDLLKTCHMNGEFLTWGIKSPSGVNNFNTIWWIDIFYKKYPIIKSYYEKYINEKSEIKEYNETLYKESMNLYYNLLNDYFIIDSGINEYYIKQSWGHLDCFNSNDDINIPKTGRTEFKNSNYIKNYLNNFR